MTPPMTPREKVARIVAPNPDIFHEDPIKRRRAASPIRVDIRQQEAFDKADAIITALASGFGDHADHSGEATNMVDHARLARLDDLRVAHLDRLSAWATYVDDKPKRDRAHQKVRWAVESGKLVPPEVCEKCGKNAGRGKDGRRLLQGHHEDYDKPLDVVWLCIICHRSVTPYNPRRGTRANAARLFEEDAIFIRTSRRNNRELAAMFGVDFTAIQQLKAGKTWAHVPSYEALLAENASLRGEVSQANANGASHWSRATEAERKLAEAENEVQRWKSAYDIAHEQATENGSAANTLRDKLAEAVGIMERLDVPHKRGRLSFGECLIEVSRFLSKEAERG